MDSKSLMQEHGEKLALAGAGLILAVYVVMGWVLWQPSEVYSNTNRFKTDADRMLATDKRPELPALPTEEQVRAQWKVDESLGNAQKGLEWVAYWRPKVTAEVKEGPPVASVSLYPPSLEEPSVDIGKVHLSWDNHKDTNAQIKNWVLMRRTGEGAWEEIARTAGDEKSYADEKTSPKQTYAYKVKAIPDEMPKVNNFKGDESPAVSITTPDTTSIRFVGGNEQMAKIEVQKHINGKWEIMIYNVRPGSKIGKKETRLIDRKMATLDFETGYELLAIANEPRITKENKIRHVWKDDPNSPGKKIQVEEQYVEETKITTLKIKYKDDTGAEKEAWMESPKEREAPAPKRPPQNPKEEAPK